MNRKMADGVGNPRIKTSSILEDYAVQWNQKLGTGISGPVRPCVHKSTQCRYALKCLLDRPKARTEVNLHIRCSGHPNIVTVFDVYANDVQFPGEAQPRARLLVVMELMDGGELFDRISKQRCFTERKAAHFAVQIAAAVQRCHSLNIAHRDLKPENLLLKDNAEDAAVKLSDFGFAKVDEGNLMTPHFTPYYVAPQVLEAQRQQTAAQSIYAHALPYTYDKGCDMWSLGVIIYIMLCGYPPFYSETPSRQMTKDMKQRIMAGEYQFPFEDWNHISEQGKEVVNRLLDVDPARRMSVQELMDHPWLHEAPETELLSPAIILDKNMLEEARESHSRQLTNMRMPDIRVALKPLKKANNPILRKRKSRSSTTDNKTAEEPPQKQSSTDMVIKRLQDVIAFCSVPPKSTEESQEELCDLVSKADDCDSGNGEVGEVLKMFSWDGTSFCEKVDKKRLADVLSDVVMKKEKEDRERNKGPPDDKLTQVEQIDSDECVASTAS